MGQAMFMKCTAQVLKTEILLYVDMPHFLLIKASSQPGVKKQKVGFFS